MTMIHIIFFNFIVILFISMWFLLIFQISTSIDHNGVIDWNDIPILTNVVSRKRTCKTKWKNESPYRLQPNSFSYNSFSRFSWKIQILSKYAHVTYPIYSSCVHNKYIFEQEQKKRTVPFSPCFVYWINKPFLSILFFENRKNHSQPMNCSIFNFFLVFPYTGYTYSHKRKWKKGEIAGLYFVDTQTRFSCIGILLCNKENFCSSPISTSKFKPFF